MSGPFTITFEPTDADYAAIAALLITFNHANGPPNSDQSGIAVLLKDDAGKVTGGLFGWINCSWLQIDLLAVPEELRGNGLGTRLLAEAEVAARARGCIGAWVDTYSFQAPEFYRRNGYESFGELKDYPPGTNRLFLSKRLA